MLKKIKIKFINRHEIRMGSPYMMADIQIEGLDIEIPNASWQDKYAISKDNKIIILIGFDIAENEPGFELYIIDREKKTVTKTKRALGLINKIRVEGKIIKLNKFIFDRTKTKTGELCCNVDDELEIG